jgi:hypothetical protein
LINAVLLITHEIDSAYWQEWELFGLREKFGKNLFVIVHIPLIFVVLVGLNLVWIPHTAGLIISISMAVCGLFAFFFHIYHLSKKRKEFDHWLSRLILGLILFFSLNQLLLTICYLTGNVVIFI